RYSLRSQAWLPLLLMLAVLALRVLTQHHILDGFPNLSPLMAFAFVGTVVFPKPLPWWSWIVLLLGLDLVSEGAAWWTQANGHIEVVAAYACYAAAAFFATRMRDRAGVLDSLLGTLICSIAFYLVTNTVSWMTDPAYTKDSAGWWQSLTVGIGIPGIPSTLVFFRNSLIADLGGATILLAVYNIEAIWRGLRTIPWVRTRTWTAALSEVV
ncbi:MAG TPA: DUF6580 family putative transport protein, partial [Verrucomicrobiaceae bacterium]